MARIAITGGTGFVGIHTGAALARAGHQLRIIARGTRSDTPRPAGAEVVRADVTSANGQLTEALRGADVVVHLVAVIRERGRQSFDRVNRQGTEAVVEASRAAGVGHLIHLGAVGASPDPAFPYLASKWAGEQAVRGGGVPHTVLRPTLVFGPGDGFFTVLTKLVRFSPFIPVAGDGRTMFQPIAVGDIARIVVQCVENGPSDRVHEVGGPEHLSYDQILDVVKVTLGAHRIKLHVPVPMIYPGALLMDKVMPHPLVTPVQLKMLGKNNITRLDSVPTQFGFDPDSFVENAGYLLDY